MKNIQFKRFTAPSLFERMSVKHLVRFFDRFGNDLTGRNLPVPNPHLGIERYYADWREALSAPDKLPESLVKAILAIEELAAPENRPRLQAAVAQAPPELYLDPTGLPECLAVQLWLLAPYQCGNSLASPEALPEASIPPAVANQEPPRTKSLGKIARLPREIREQLNRRLENDEEGKSLLEWLNGLPEVQAVLASEFGGRPLSKQNLSEWKQNGFRDWQMRQSALLFAQNLDADNAALPQSLTGPLSEKLAHWVALRYAAAAQALAGMDDNPETELHRLRDFCRDIVALRRGDISAGRLGLEQARLVAEQADTDIQKEKEFWIWTQRPDIQAKLYPKRDPDQIRREVVQMLDRELLGVCHPAEEPQAPAIDPAILI